MPRSRRVQTVPVDIVHSTNPWVVAPVLIQVLRLLSKSESRPFQTDYNVLYKWRQSRRTAESLTLCKIPPPTESSVLTQLHQLLDRLETALAARTAPNLQLRRHGSNWAWVRKP